MPQKITLFIHPVSQPARACWALVKAAHMDEVEVKQVALEKGEHKSPEFLAINPNGTVPALAHIDSEGATFNVGESHTIMRYLCAVFQDSIDDNWYSADPQRRARVDEYLDWHHTHTRQGVPFFFHKYIATRSGVTPNAERRENGKNNYLSTLDYLETVLLARNTFIAGNQLSLADLSAYMELGPLQWDDEFKDVIASKPKVSAWIAGIVAQPWHEEVMALVKTIVVPVRA
jgi:glutathione S-transferase